MKSSASEKVSNEELRRHLSKYSTPDLIRIIDQTAAEASATIQTLTDEINLRLMEEAE